MQPFVLSTILNIQVKYSGHPGSPLSAKGPELVRITPTGLMNEEQKEKTDGTMHRTLSVFRQEQEALWYLGGLRIIQALGEQPKEDRKIFEYLEPAGTYTFSYAPYREDTAFYVIEGEAVFSSGKTIAHATSGT